MEMVVDGLGPKEGLIKKIKNEAADGFIKLKTNFI